MTEKRFTSKVVDWWHNVDKVRVVFDKGEWIDADNCAKLLNALHEENEQLKKQLESKEKAHTRCDKLYQKLYDENEELKKVFRKLITSGYWDDDYLTEQDWNDLKRWIENVFEKVMMND